VPQNADRTVLPSRVPAIGTGMNAGAIHPIPFPAPIEDRLMARRNCFLRLETAFCV
jgi:hypothetical protein